MALRTWKTFWFRRRTKLRVRPDNVPALMLLLLLRIRGVGLNLIARQIALDLGDCAFIPSLVERLPSVAGDAAVRRGPP